MAFGLGFGIGLRGLNAARLAMQIAGQNVANANTPGYTRQRAIFGSTLPVTIGRGLYVGTGVQVETIDRVLDSRLDARIRTQNGLFGAAFTDFRRLSEIEGIFGEPGTGGMTSLFNEYFSSVDKLRSDAGSRALRGGMLQASKSLTSGFNLLAERFQALGGDTIDEVRGLLKDVNRYAEEIASLNNKIVTLESNGNPANDLRDRREAVIKDLSRLMDTQAVERKNGSLDILAGGYLLVSGGNASTLKAGKDAANRTRIFIGETSATIRPSQGRIAALIRSESQVLPGITSSLDKLAFNLALEVNRIHTTGMPKSGPFTSLVSENPIKDGDGDGDFADELLGFGGFPFEVSKGELWIAVSDLKTGNIERTRITVSPNETTLGDFAAQISKIANLNASVDPTGRLRIQADEGFGFDFSNRLDSAPNSKGTFGSASATLGGSKSGPFEFSTTPATFTVTVDGGSPATITLNSTDFKVPSSVEADELVDVLNKKFQSASLSLEAVAIGDNISFKTNSAGSTSSLLVTDGTNGPIARLGIPTGLTATGRSGTVAVSISGTFSGDSNGNFRFVPESDGTIGITKDLKIAVYNDQGTKIASLSVGKGYSYGDELEVADGVKVSFGPGDVSATNGDQFGLETLVDGDTSDVLVALGLNIYFTGSKASDIGVSERLETDPDLIAAGLTQAAGDSQNLAKISALRGAAFTSLDGNDLEGFYADLVSDVGFETKKASDLLESQDSLLKFLENQRESVSGVNLDEEMVDLVRFQQSFEANSRFINIVSEMTQTLINLGR